MGGGGGNEFHTIPACVLVMGMNFTQFQLVCILSQKHLKSKHIKSIEISIQRKLTFQKSA